jgi:hypothetical protein
VVGTAVLTVVTLVEAKEDVAIEVGAHAPF